MCHQSKFLNLLLLSRWTCNQVVDSYTANPLNFKAWLLNPIFWFSNWIQGVWDDLVYDRVEWHKRIHIANPK